MDVEIDSYKEKWYVTIIGSAGDGTDNTYMRSDGTFAKQMNSRRYNGTVTEGDGYYFESALAAETAAKIHGHNITRTCPQKE
jgi:hypothetical protein